jgi:cold shock CspA family protein
LGHRPGLAAPIIESGSKSMFREEPLEGQILRLFDDHGFVGLEDGREIYFHRSTVTDAAFEALVPGSAVELRISDADRPLGPQAVTLRPIASPRIPPGPPLLG